MFPNFPQSGQMYGQIGQSFTVAFAQSIAPILCRVITATELFPRSFEELAFQIFSLYISPSDIPSKDLREIVRKSYSSSVFRAPEVTPLVTVDEEKQLHLLELFHGEHG